jgi:AcrR family transcriptional regulator
MTDPRVAKTRAALGEAILALAAEKPFNDITITEIAERAGVGYASFFRHYRDKDGLLSAVADTMVDDLLAVIMPAFLEEDTLAGSVALCQFVDQHRPITRVLLAGGAETNVRRHIIARAIESAHFRTVADDRVPFELVITHCVVATLGLLTWWLEHDQTISADTMGGVVNRLVMAPVRQFQRG